jgi:hypothetical protein
MVTILGLSLYSYLYLKLEKCCAFLTISYVFNKIKEQEGGTGSAGKWGEGCGEVPQRMYIHVSKCKNEKIK